MEKTGIYLHIPFCVKKCGYCAFLSAPAGEEEREKYVKALLHEIKGCKEYFTSGKEVCKADFTYRKRTDTIYIGGGTPSVLTCDQIGRILDAVREVFEVDADAEITLEANPGTLGHDEDEILDTLKSYRSMGINRLSMGVQSMSDDVLAFIGRIHTAEDVRRDQRLAREAGFTNISLDLILSLPVDRRDRTPGKLSSQKQSISDLKKIIAMRPEHISCYSLQIEEGTPFAKMFEDGDIDEISDEEDRDTYHRVCDMLCENGYERYEISNFARGSEYRSRHNSRYWDMSDYVGLGLGASGFVSGTRYRNISDISEYIRLCSENCEPDELREEIHVNDSHDNISEAVFTGLRRTEGIRYEDALRAGGMTSNGEHRKAFWKYYRDALDEAESFVRTGHLIIDDDGMRLTDAGIDISNRIMALFV